MRGYGAPSFGRLRLPPPWARSIGTSPAKPIRRDTIISRPTSPLVCFLRYRAGSRKPRSVGGTPEERARSSPHGWRISRRRRSSGEALDPHQNRSSGDPLDIGFERLPKRRGGASWAIARARREPIVEWAGGGSATDPGQKICDLLVGASETTAHWRASADGARHSLRCVARAKTSAQAGRWSDQRSRRISVQPGLTLGAVPDRLQCLAANGSALRGRAGE